MSSARIAAVVVVAMLAAAAVPAAARADGELCARGARHHGAKLDLDVAGADVHDVLRLLADAGNANLVVSDEVAGKVTLRVHQVAWDAAMCTIAGTHHLRITVQDGIVLVRPAGK